MKVAIIPARGGSKRIPRKNIKDFCGKPMIAWSIEAAQKSQCFDRIIVSTDDDEIAEIAKKYGAEIPFIRPYSLANDYIGTTPVIRHAIESINTQDSPVSLACCLYATAPFVSPDDLKNGLEILTDAEANYTFSVTSYPFPIQRAIRLNNVGRIEMFQPEHFNTRSQDLEDAYHDAGQFYWGTAEAWLHEKIIFSASSVPILIPRHRVQDIDTHQDWLRAEIMFNTINV